MEITEPVCINLGNSEYPDWRLGHVIREHDLHGFLVVRIDGQPGDKTVHRHQVKEARKGKNSQ